MFLTKAEAEAWEQGIEGKSTPRLDAIADAVFARRWAKGNNVKSVRGHIKELCSFFGHGRAIYEIDTAKVEQFKSYLLLERGNNGATVNRKLATLSSILDHARRLGYVTRMPELDYEKEDEGKTRFLTTAEVEEFKRVVDKHPIPGREEWGDAFDFLLETGCRYSEMANAEIIYMPSRGGRNAFAKFVDTKNGKDRMVPLTFVARRALYSEDQAPQMPYDKFHSLWMFYKAQTSMCQDPDVTPHVLRHTCASRLVQSGVPLYTVSKWLGHSSIKTTERYAHLTVSDLDVALAALER
jgi:site-specific recombinase XerD